MSRKLKTMIRDAAWNEKSLRRVFKKFDANENGEITSREFKQAFNKLNLFATNKEIESLVDKLDRTGDGVVRYEDFIAAAEVEAGPGSKEQRKIKEKWGDASDDEYDRRRRRRRKYEDSDDEVDERRKYEDSDDDRRKYRNRHKDRKAKSREKTKRDDYYSDDEESYENDKRRTRGKRNRRRKNMSDSSDEEDRRVAGTAAIVVAANHHEIQNAVDPRIGEIAERE